MEPSPPNDPTLPPSEDLDATTAATHAAAPTVVPALSLRHFHHYEVCLREDGKTLHELGRGAMGVSYKARDVNLDTFVAIKVIRAGLPGAVQARARFRREARAAAQLRHPNVASVFHFGETPTGECFYAMEFIEGETLADRVRREGPLPVALVIEIALQVTAALIAADRRGLVHRDLKPANLMLVTPSPGHSPTRSDPDRSTASAFRQVTVKVIDFGLAKAVAVAGAESSAELPLTQVGGFFGTPTYASPEQAEGGEVDARSDIYSLGVTLWYLLSGKVPYGGRTLGEIHDRRRHRPPPEAVLADAGVPAPLVQLLVSMLAANPAGRPASPADLHDALEHCRLTVQGGDAAGRSRNGVPGLPRRRGRLAKPFAALAGCLLLAGLGTAAFFGFRQWERHAAGGTDAPLAALDQSIAVLPLESLSEDKDNAFFADGIQDDVLTSLAKIKKLKVISRSSVMSYRDPASRNLRTIGNTLDVANVLTGSVRRAGNRVLVNVELVNAATGRTIWAERYDRTLADAITLQGELATEIATALRATLSPEEKARVEAKPTDNAEAYVLYLRARDFQTRPFTLLQNLQAAARLYQQAIALDPQFAMARARLAATLACIYVNFEPTPELRAQARAEADAALRLRPDLGEAHLGRAFCLYWTERDYPGALRALEKAGQLLPGSHEIDMVAGAIGRRQGRWTEGRASMRRALARDPRNAQIAREILFTSVMMRDWPTAARDGERAVALAPNDSMVLVERSCLTLWTRGDLGSLQAALAAAPAGFDPDGQITLFRWDTACAARDFDAAERVVNASALDSIVSTFGAVLPRPYLLGCAALGSGDAARARPLFEAALGPMEEEARRVPGDAFRQGYLGVLYAYLGRKEDALRQGRRAVELLPESRDTCFGPIPSGLLALILARTGERDEALVLIERLLQTPAALSPAVDSGISQSELRLRWQWDPLRGDPRFEKLLAGPEPKTIY